MTGFNPARGFGVYMHWPYCARICPYCDFNVYAAKARDTDPLFQAILADLRGWRARTGERQVDSIFLGGGTPSLMTGAQVAGVIEAVDQLWGLKPGAEITLEANPDDKARFADFAAVGVNRLSLGLQSLDDKRLKFLGRTHSAADALAALDAARSKFRSVSIDMIYALPGEGLVGWREELSRAVALDADHLSLYELTIEPGAAFAYAVQRREWAPLEDEVAAELYEITQELTLAAGYDGYEISNHARGAAHQSVHNRVYWSSGDWVAVGPGAHGRLTADGDRLAIEAADNPGVYLHQVKANGLGWASADKLNALAHARERVAMGLRVVEGLAQTDITELGLQLNAARIAELVTEGLLTATAQRVALTARGRLLADRIAAEVSP
ncbi:MAG: radical SAM family heme chaperone HemW [Hyphomonadaceae bacterium]